MKNYLPYGLFFLLLLLFAACDAPLSLSLGEAKRRAMKEYLVLRDTSQIGAVYVSQDTSSHWFALYNKEQIRACVYLFRVDNAQEPSHEISLRHRQAAIVDKLVFEDITHNGDLELLVYLHYNYDLSYQAKEVVVFQNPFDSLPEEIFSFMTLQMWEHIESFDSTYGVPEHRKRIENNASVEFFEGKILIKGTIDGKKHHFIEYEWGEFHNGFKKILDEDFYEEEEEEEKQISTKREGNRHLFKINTHEYGCQSFLIEDKDGKVLRLPRLMHDALLCSQVTSMSKNGRFLVYTDKLNDQILLYDFDDPDATIILYDKIQATEGISDLVWYQEKGILRFAFVVTNFEEFEFDTQVHIWEYEAKNKKWKQLLFDRPVVFECDFYGRCSPEKEHDFRFSEAGSLIIRFQKTGRSLDDFAILKMN